MPVAVASEIVSEDDDLINKCCSRPTGPKFEARKADSRGWVFGKGAARVVTIGGFTATYVSNFSLLLTPPPLLTL